MPIPLSDLVAGVNFAPKEWQSGRPDDSWTSKPPVENSADLTRILALPRRPIPGEAREQALVDLLNERLRLPDGTCRCKDFKRDCILSLRPVQAWMLYEAGLCGGLLGAVGVGWGKTAVNLLAPLCMGGCRTALLLVPVGLLDQLVREYQLWGQHFKTPSLVVHGRDFRASVPGTPVLHVLPYSRLSRPESSVVLDTLAPDLVIADECDALRNRSASRTMRVLRYFAAHEDARFCGWTGSMTDSSVTDFAHLSALALRHRSPLPLDPEVVDDWARALDASDFPAPAGALLKLCEPGEHVREGFRRRLVESPGVVSTTDPSLEGVELVIEERPAPPLPANVQEALDQLRTTWVRPDGEELVEALAVAKSACELACGFYYRWIFPRGEPVHQILEWLEARKQWNRELRLKLRRAEPHLDSPDLCARAAARAWGAPGDPDLPRWKADTWPRWEKAKGTVKPETVPVRLDSFLAQDAAAWALENRGIVWYINRAFGEWVAEISRLPLHTGGPKAGARILAETGETSIICSLESHGRGRDGLQRLFATQLFTQPPVSGSRWEQALGRLHRPGQVEDTVTGFFYRHTTELADRVDEALNRALYVDQTLGGAQKLRLGIELRP